MKISLTNNINSIIKQSQNRLAANVKKQTNILGAELVKEARASMDVSKSGVVYKIRGVYHVASAPGEPLANITGQAKGSITYFTSGNILNFGGENVALTVWETRNLNSGNRPTLKTAIDKVLPSMVLLPPALMK